MTPVYYNDFEPFACESIRRNIARGRLGAGLVDDRSIVDVQPADLDGYAICHFFAGIGGFELARLMAGWPDDLQLWTGGFPCQQVSCAGKGEGIGTENDPTERSGMWWEWLRLIRACRPDRVLAENVGALRTRGGDGVLDAMAREGYTCRPLVVGACNVGAPHRRYRVWIVCELADARRGGSHWRSERKGPEQAGETITEGCGVSLADAAVRGQRADRGAQWNAGHVDERDTAMAQPMRGRLEGCSIPPGPGREGPGAAGVAGAGEGGMADAGGTGLEGRRIGSGGGGTELAEPSIGGIPRWPARPGEPQHEWEEPRLVNAKQRGRQEVQRNIEAERGLGPPSASSPTPTDGGQPQPAMGVATARLPRRLVELVRRHSDFDDAQAEAWLIRNKVRIRNAWRRHALKAIGNAIVPQVAAAVMHAWLECEAPA